MPQRISTRTQLKPAQQKVLANLRENAASELTRERYQTLTGVSRSQAAYDIAELVEAGILERVGGGRSTRYRLGEAGDGASPRRWTSDRIRSELERFCAGRTTWPTAREFKDAGRTDLYVAASRYGGVRFWAETLGLAREARAALPAPRLLRRWSWAASGAALGALAAGAVVAVLHPWTKAPEDARPTPRLMVVTQRAPAANPPQRRAAKPRQRPAARATPATAQSTAARTSVNTTSSRTTAPASTPSVSRERPAPPAAPVTGRVTPLAAPHASSGPPKPLTAP